MKYFVTLRDRRTMQEARVEDVWHEGWDVETLLFDWTENNFSCDCNRSIALYDIDLASDDSRMMACGEGAIDLVRIEDENGNVLFEEDWA